MDNHEKFRQKIYNTLQWGDIDGDTEWLEHNAFYLSDPRGHVDIHTKDNNCTILNRVLEGKECDGRFTSEAIAWDAICNLIEYNADSICDWLDVARENEKQIFSAEIDPLDENPIGYGFIRDNTHHVKAFKSNCVGAVLIKNPMMPLGFGIITAFPGNNEAENQMDKFFEISTKETIDALHKSDDYKRKTSLEKSYLEHICSDTKAQAKYYPEDGNYDEKIKIQYPDKTSKYAKYEIQIQNATMYLSKKDTKLKAEVPTKLINAYFEQNPNAKRSKKHPHSLPLNTDSLNFLRSIDFQKHCKNCPELPAFIDEAINIYNKNYKPPLKHISKEQTVERPSPRIIPFEHKNSYDATISI
ncbi:hypothetical protein J6A31_04615 [bacterium]|nr:hypothetical protein [bacterium]